MGRVSAVYFRHSKFLPIVRCVRLFCAMLEHYSCRHLKLSKVQPKMVKQTAVDSSSSFSSSSRAQLWSGARTLLKFPILCLQAQPLKGDSG